VGHACGHNIIGAAGIGAGLAAAAVVEEAGGRLAVIGTPAEEGGGGKVLMARAGAFAEVDVAMMVHPADSDLTTMCAIGVRQLVASYRGRAAHAAASPEQGLNALDAAVLGYVNVMALRQHIRSDERVHGVLTETGEAPNVVPERAGAHWYVRSPHLGLLEALGRRVVACLEAGATAAGCELSWEWSGPTYAELVTNPALVEAYRANAAALGRVVHDPGPDQQVLGSTDMGNVSQLVPSIHPMIKVAPAGVSLHSREFARWGAAPEGDAAVLDGAKALAMTAVDVWADAALLADARRAFGEVRAGGPGAP
jgi:amidohydrolase